MTKNQRKIFYPTIFFLGAILMIFQVEIYRNTIIDLIIPFGIVIIIGLLAFILDFKKYKMTYEYSGIGLYLYSTINYLIGFGFIACSTFMLSNYYFADKKVETQSYEILNRTYIQGTKKSGLSEKQPVFKIKYNSDYKELVFASKYYETMDYYNIVEFDIRKGFFGFDILENKKLK
ncbi:MAG: hypothetical protein ED556_08715 [Winogradskyella sp.]|uniref:hypothetical protein n=1 Tax=Winogradskyella sp. TaxID=1883156 RepID=UPI000F3D2F64|nr:hypothetical protein [Winogradskyella sp.]RNC86365.1 MAG: hypothetical protein ED556_08715 [Winogradskyella sp.]